MGISKIKKVTANGIFKSDYGVDINGTKGFYKYIYEFEDTECISANHKVKEPFKVGETVEYEIKGSSDYGSWGKVFKPKEQPQQKNDNYVKGMEVGHAVNNAVNLLCAGFEFKDVIVEDNEEKIKAYARKILGISGQLKNE